MKLSEAMREGAKETRYDTGNYMSAHKRDDKFDCCAVGAAVYHKLLVELKREPTPREVRDRANGIAQRLNLIAKGPALLEAVGTAHFTKQFERLVQEGKGGLGAAVLTLNDQAVMWCKDEDPRPRIADGLEKIGL